MRGTHPPGSRGAPSGVQGQGHLQGDRGLEPPDKFSNFRAATLLDINTELWENDINVSVVIFLNCE